jgi:hypothetical protein
LYYRIRCSSSFSRRSSSMASSLHRTSETLLVQHETAGSTSRTRVVAVSLWKRKAQQLVFSADCAHSSSDSLSMRETTKLLSVYPPTHALCTNFINLQTRRKTKGQLWKGKQPQVQCYDGPENTERNESVVVRNTDSKCFQGIKNPQERSPV